MRNKKVNVTIFMFPEKLKHVKKILLMQVNFNVRLDYMIQINFILCFLRRKGPPDLYLKSEEAAYFVPNVRAVVAKFVPGAFQKSSVCPCNK